MRSGADGTFPGIPIPVSVILKCHDLDGELYSLNIARNRMTLSSFSDDGIRKQVERWANSIPEMA
jgi:hypothetical protein